MPPLCPPTGPRARTLALALALALALCACAGQAAQDSGSDGGMPAGGGAAGGGAGGSLGGASSGGLNAEPDPVDDSPWAPDPGDEPPSDDPEAAGPVGWDPAACGVEADPPAGLCEDAAGGADGGGGEGDPPDACAVPDDLCDEPDFCAPGTDPDCVFEPGEDADCAVPDAFCDEPDLCAAGTDPDCEAEPEPDPDVDPICAEEDGFCDEPDPCPEGTDPDCVASVDPIAECATADDICDEPDPCPEGTDPDCGGGSDPYGGVDDCDGLNFDGECDIDTGLCADGTDATDCSGSAETPECADPFAGPGTCTVVCCDASEFRMRTADSETCARQWRKCRGHRKTVGIGYAAPACSESLVLFRRGSDCPECCAKCKHTRRYKFVNVSVKCTAAARMFCDDRGRGGLRRARWGSCGGPEVDLDAVLGLSGGDDDWEDTDDDWSEE